MQTVDSGGSNKDRWIDCLDKGALADANAIINNDAYICLTTAGFRRGARVRTAACLPDDNCQYRDIGPRASSRPARRMQNTTPGNGEISIVSGFPQMVPARNPILRRHIAYRCAAAAFTVVGGKKKKNKKKKKKKSAR